METTDDPIGWWLLRGVAGLILGFVIGGLFLGPVGAIVLASAMAKIMAGSRRKLTDTPTAIADQR